MWFYSSKLSRKNNFENTFDFKKVTVSFKKNTMFFLRIIFTHLMWTSMDVGCLTSADCPTNQVCHSLSRACVARSRCPLDPTPNGILWPAGGDVGSTAGVYCKKGFMVRGSESNWTNVTCVEDEKGKSIQHCLRQLDLGFLCLNLSEILCSL